MCEHIHLYKFYFEKSSHYLIKFMRVFNVEAHINLNCVIHEINCGTECKFNDVPTLLINGFHWHVVNDYICDKLKIENTRTLNLELPYQYSFEDVDDNTMYRTLKYNDCKRDYEIYSDAVEMDFDAECIEFTVTYYDEWVPFDLFLKKKGLGLAEYKYEDEIVTEEGTYYCLDHELNVKCMELELDETLPEGNQFIIHSSH